MANVVIKDNGYSKYLEALLKLDGKTVAAGVPSGQFNRDGVEIALYASIHDTKAAPGWINRVNDTILSRANELANIALDAAYKNLDMDEALNRIGTIMSGVYKLDIVEHLFDTGDLFRSVKSFLAAGIK